MTTSRRRSDVNDLPHDDVHVYDPETDYDHEDVAIMRGISGRAVVLPRSLSRLKVEAFERATDLQRTALQMAELGEQLERQVHELRRAGASWSAIGWCVGTTGEAARQRWAG